MQIPSVKSILRSSFEFALSMQPGGVVPLKRKLSTKMPSEMLSVPSSLASPRRKRAVEGSTSMEKVSTAKEARLLTVTEPE